MTGPERRTVARTFEPTPEAPRLARRLVEQALVDAGAHASLEAAVLLVSELTTNAVLHARTRVEVEVAIAGGVVRVTISDLSPALPVTRAFSQTAGSGRGLHLVESIARRWGVEADARTGGKHVWFELDPVSAEPAMEFDIDAVPSL